MTWVSRAGFSFERRWVWSSSGIEEEGVVEKFQKSK